MKREVYQPHIRNLSRRGRGNWGEILVDEKTGDVMARIYNVMSVLATNEPNRRSMWIKIPRGTIEEFGDYTEYKKAGEVKNYKEFNEWWLAEFPEEIAWFRVIVDKFENKYWVSVWDRDTSVALMFAPTSNEQTRLDMFHIAEPLLELIEAELATITHDVDGYNRYIAENLPYNRRNGKIKRSIYNSLYPDEKITVEQKYMPMLRDLTTNSDSHSAKGRIAVMTVREYLKIWRLAVEAMNDATREESVSDIDFFKSKNFHGSTLLEYDMDSPSAFTEWNSLSDNWAYHRLDLQYRMITFIARKNDCGWWFIVRADALHILDQILRVVYALYLAGIPVNLSSSKQLVEMIDQNDYVGIQPSRKYKYHTIYDGELGNYTSLHGDSNEGEVIANAVWEPVREIRLK